MGDHPGGGVRPSFGYWLTIVGILGDHPVDNGNCPCYQGSGQEGGLEDDILMRPTKLQLENDEFGKYNN